LTAGEFALRSRMNVSVANNLCVGMLCRHGQLEEFIFHSRWTETGVEEVQST